MFNDGVLYNITAGKGNWVIHIINLCHVAISLRLVTADIEYLVGVNAVGTWRIS